MTEQEREQWIVHKLSNEDFPEIMEKFRELHNKIEVLQLEVKKLNEIIDKAIT